MGIDSRRQHNEAARKRWGLLARALHNTGARRPAGLEEKKKKEEDSRDSVTDIISVRRISNFGVVKISPLVDDWFTYSTGRYSIKVRHVSRPLTPEDLMGFNNTGNVCVWPSEEVLAYYALYNLNRFDGKSVLELGGGMSSLAGLCIAKYGSSSAVHLTDGNENSVANVQRILQSNDLFNAPNIACSVFKWGDVPSVQYDVILAADCLFFDTSRKDLVYSMWHGMKDGGKGFVTAPRRGTTLDDFLVEADRIGFHVSVHDSYNEDVWERHLQLKSDCSYYDSNIHYPVLIILNKRIVPN